MTENELRKKVVSIVNGWVGGKQGSSIHKEILKIYNEYASAHGMALAHESYAWCDITASAAWIKAGMAQWVPIAMSCGQSISKAKKLGIWVENDAYKPKIADAVIYDWEDDGKGDDTTGHDHIGIVVSVGSDTFSVVEGNAGSPSQVRKIQRKVNQRYIRGFICPDYKSIAKKFTPSTKKPSLDELAKQVINGDYGSGAVRKAKLNSMYKKGEIDYTYEQIQERVNEMLKPSGKPVEKPVEKPAEKPKEKAKEVKATQPAQSKDSSYNREYKTIAALNLRNGAGTQNKVLVVMPKGSSVRCYGFYTRYQGVNWLYVQYKKGDTLYTGFCSKEWLA